MYKTMRKIILFALMVLFVGMVQAQEKTSKNNRVSLGDMAFVLPEPCIMIGTYDAKGIPNVMMAAWGGQIEDNQITIRLSKHKTTDNIRLKKVFTISFATEATMAESDYLGAVSGNDVADKVARVGFTTHRAGKIDAPVIDQYPVTLECRLVSFENGILVGEVVNTTADKSVLDAEGHIDMEKVKPIVFDPISLAYRSVGSSVGKAWESGNKYK
ncbi:flavin reductase family protein [Prevotella falsenii]